MSAWDQVSVTLNIIKRQTELEPPNVLIKQKITGIQKIMKVLGPFSRFHGPEGGSAWEPAL